MHLLNKEFDKIVCINLAERPDKREKLQKKFDELGIEVEWFTSVKYGFANIIAEANSPNKKFNISQPNEVGCAISHYTVIKKALLDGVKNLFVFEDDIKFHDNFNEKLEKYWIDLPKQCDMVLLYSFMFKLLPQNKRISKKWLTAYNSWSLLAYGMNKRVMEEYIRKQDLKFTISDAVTYTMQEESNFNIYCAIPTLCIPDVTLGSEIRGNNKNYQFNPTVLNLGYSDANYI